MAAPPALEPGAEVRVSWSGPAGHVRTPGYLRGARGRVVCGLGRHRNPERLAYGDPDAPVIALYRVEFRLVDVFDDYQGPVSDVVTADIYEHWLQEVEHDG